jgi:leucyl/phenylalanyl-tRNA--protein transferase
MSSPDPDFPFLAENERFQFPDPNRASHNIVAVGGNLSPGMLLSAYEQGIFPWYNEDDPILWQSPDPRFLIFPEKLHVSGSMERVFRRGDFRLTFDTDFEGVIQGCAAVYRPGQEGTWISGDIIDAYTALHRLGWAHSAEAWQGDNLVGGCYGIRLGRIFVGESMFALLPNASKAAFLSLARHLFADGLRFIDCQVHTPHLESLGGEIMPRKKFIALLRTTLAERRPGSPEADLLDRRGTWPTSGFHRAPRG